VFSSTVAPRRLPDAAEARSGVDDSEHLARALWSGLPCRVEDHGTLGCHTPAQFALWPLTPHQWHVVGWVSHTPSATALT